MTLASAVRSLPSQKAVTYTKLFVAFVCAALILVTAWLAVRGRDEAIREATLANTNLTWAIAQQIDSMFSETARILDTLAFEMERVNKDPNTLVRLQPVMVNYTAANEAIHSVIIFDSHGVRILTSEALLSPLPPVENREYFTFHRDNLSLLRHIGKPYLNRINDSWLIPVSRRFDDSMGQFAGVVVFTIQVDHLLQLMMSYEIGQHGALALLLADGTILVRRPFAEAEVGKSTSETALFKLVQKSLSGSFSISSPIDGVMRYLSFEHLKNHPLLVIVGLSKQEVLQHWQSTTVFQSAWILMLCVFIGFLGDRMIRLVNQRVRVEHRLRVAQDDLTTANSQLTHFALYDGLTALANRRYFDEYLAKEFAQCARTRRPLGLIMIDVDHFKLYNDSFGHPQGDKCLQIVAQAVRSAVGRPHDFVARYGGEEFAVLLPETDVSGTYEVAEAIRAAVALLSLPFTASPFGHVSISAGFAVHMSPGPKEDSASLLDEADKALYQAKKNGRNTVFSNDH